MSERPQDMVFICLDKH